MSTRKQYKQKAGSERERRSEDQNRYRQHSNLHIRSDRLPDDEDDIDELYNTQDTANIDRQSQSQGHSQGHSNNHRIDKSNHDDDILNTIRDDRARASYINGSENADRNKYQARRKQEKDRKAAASQKPILKQTRQPDGSERDNSHRRSEQHDRGLSSKTRPAQQNPQQTSNAAHAKQTLARSEDPHSSSEEDEDEDPVPPIAVKQTSNTAPRHTHNTTEDDEEAQTGNVTEDSDSDGEPPRNVAPPQKPVKQKQSLKQPTSSKASTQPTNQSMSTKKTQTIRSTTRAENRDEDIEVEDSRRNEKRAQDHPRTASAGRPKRSAAKSVTSPASRKMPSRGRPSSKGPAAVPKRGDIVQQGYLWQFAEAALKLLEVAPYSAVRDGSAQGARIMCRNASKMSYGSTQPKDKRKVTTCPAAYAVLMIDGEWTVVESLANHCLECTDYENKDRLDRPKLRKLDPYTLFQDVEEGIEMPQPIDIGDSSDDEQGDSKLDDGFRETQDQHGHAIKRSNRIAATQKPIAIKDHVPKSLVPKNPKKTSTVQASTAKTLPATSKKRPRPSKLSKEIEATDSDCSDEEVVASQPQKTTKRIKLDKDPTLQHFTLPSDAKDVSLEDVGASGRLLQAFHNDGFRSVGSFLREKIAVCDVIEMLDIYQAHLKTQRMDEDGLSVTFSIRESLAAARVRRDLPIAIKLLSAQWQKQDMGAQKALAAAEKAAKLAVKNGTNRHDQQDDNDRTMFEDLEEDRDISDDDIQPLRSPRQVVATMAESEHHRVTKRVVPTAEAPFSASPAHNDPHAGSSFDEMLANQPGQLNRSPGHLLHHRHVSPQL